MKLITRCIKNEFDRIYELMNKVYSFEKPKLKIVHYESSTVGSYKIKRNIIVINSTGEHWQKTIIHELCHAINEYNFNQRKVRKLGHNKKFWELCYEFGLNENDYGYGLTNTMKAAKEAIVMDRRINKHKVNTL